MYAEANQLIMPETIPDSYWVEVMGHAIIPDGTRYLVVHERSDSLLLAWRDGVKPDFGGTLLPPEYVRKAAVSVYPVVRKDLISSLGLHQKLFLLGVARRFKQTEAAYISMGDAEEAYSIVCEEHGKKQRGHTQLWKYVKELSALGVIGTESSGVGQRGKTTLISLPRVPASDLEQELCRILCLKRG